MVVKTFVEVDRDIPVTDGGSTATAMFRVGNRLHIANTRDSTSFIVIYEPANMTSGWRKSTKITWQNLGVARTTTWAKSYCNCISKGRWPFTIRTWGTNRTCRMSDRASSHEADAFTSRRWIPVFPERRQIWLIPRWWSQARSRAIIGGMTLDCRLVDPLAIKSGLP